MTRWRQSEQGASAQPSVGGVGVAAAASRRWFPASDPPTRGEPQSKHEVLYLLPSECFLLAVLGGIKRAEHRLVASI